MPRCAVVLSTFRPVTGGYQRQLEAVFSHLRDAHGWDAHVITRAQPAAPGKDFVSGLPVQRTGVSGSAFARGAVARLWALRPDIVVTAQLGSAAVAASAYCRTTRRPLIIRLAGSESLTSGPARLIRSLAPSCTLVAPSRHQLDAASGWPQRKEVLPNGVSVGQPDAQPRAVAVWYGRDTAAKNPVDFMRLVARTPDVAFLALGDATLPAASNLEQSGWVEDTGAILGQSWVFVSTSRSEGSPNVALQALALGVPVVAFANRAYEEVQRAYPGYVHLVAFGDVGGLRDAVRHAMNQQRLMPAGVPSVVEVARNWDVLLRSAL